MQVTQADTDSTKRVGVEEHLIKFRPSPNFKNMRKFIKSRYATVTGSPDPAVPGAPEPPPPPNIRVENTNSEVQPPLPLDPPPPDNLILNLQVKKEIDDSAYQNNIQLSPAPENLEPEGNGELVKEHFEEICREFIRGTCERQGTCRFAHKLDLSQLEKVYTFCRKFQNAVCNLTNCKYVHATVFEEQHFYRTGRLPPHVFAHHKVNVMQPPPPPPKEPPVVPFNIDFSNPPPPLPEMEKPLITCVPASSIEARGAFGNDNRNASNNRNSTSLKREWTAMVPFAAPPCDIAYNDQLSKKCKHCDILEFRLQYHEDKVEKMKRSKEELNKKLELLEKKNEMLTAILMVLRKLTISTKLPAQSHVNGLNGDKEKTLLEQLNNIFSIHSRLSTLSEEK